MRSSTAAIGREPTPAADAHLRLSALHMQQALEISRGRRPGLFGGELRGAAATGIGSPTLLAATLYAGIDFWWRLKPRIFRLPGGRRVAGIQGGIFPSLTIPAKAGIQTGAGAGCRPLDFRFSWLYQPPAMLAFAANRSRFDFSFILCSNPLMLRDLTSGASAPAFTPVPGPRPPRRLDARTPARLHRRARRHPLRRPRRRGRRHEPRIRLSPAPPPACPTLRRRLGRDHGAPAPGMAPRPACSRHRAFYGTIKPIVRGGQVVATLHRPDNKARDGLLHRHRPGRPRPGADARALAPEPEVHGEIPRVPRDLCELPPPAASTTTDRLFGPSAPAPPCLSCSDSAPSGPFRSHLFRGFPP